MSKEQVAQLVRARLQGQHPGGVTIDVVDDLIRQENGSWRVPVRPSAQPPRIFEYYEVLADVETELSENERLNVWLVPTMPEEAGSDDKSLTPPRQSP
jgi:hypothetical protein